MFIPHFYYNFYVFTYATGLTSGLALADQITKTATRRPEQYIDNMLKAGSSARRPWTSCASGRRSETPAPSCRP